jgi:hypothetical protein
VVRAVREVLIKFSGDQRHANRVLRQAFNARAEE